jgi:glycosyltransferase involved in cell wall biosynthesis
MSDCRVLALLPFLVKRARSLDVFRAMPQRGIDVTVAFCDDASTMYDTDGMEDFEARRRLIDLSKTSRTECFEIVNEVIAGQRIDLVVQVGASTLYANLARWKESNPKIRITDILYNEFGHTLNHFLYEPCFDSVIVESEYMVRYVKRASSKKHPATEVVRSGVDLESFRPADHQARNGTPLTIGYIGRMSAEKNPLGFIELAEQLLKLDAELTFRMAGNGPARKLVEQRLAESSYSNEIFYAGSVDVSLQELHELDVLIVPSKFDGCPAIVMEANACGVPVLAAPVGGIPELIDEGVNGYLVHPQEFDQINDLLGTWKQSPESLTQLQRSARDHACRVFDREHMMDDYAAAFRRIAALPSTS